VVKATLRRWEKNKNKGISIPQTFAVLMKESKKKPIKVGNHLITLNKNDYSPLLKDLRARPKHEQDPLWKLPLPNKPRQSQEQQKIHLDNIDQLVEDLGPNANQAQREHAIKEYLAEHNIRWETYKSWCREKRLCQFKQELCQLNKMLA